MAQTMDACIIFLFNIEYYHSWINVIYPYNKHTINAVS